MKKNKLSAGLLGFLFGKKNYLEDFIKNRTCSFKGQR